VFRQKNMLNGDDTPDSRRSFYDRSNLVFMMFRSADEEEEGDASAVPHRHPLPQSYPAHAYCMSILLTILINLQRCADPSSLPASSPAPKNLQHQLQLEFKAKISPPKPEPRWGGLFRSSFKLFG
jgi:hypothetical protein